MFGITGYLRFYKVKTVFKYIFFLNFTRRTETSKYPKEIKAIANL